MSSWRALTNEIPSPLSKLQKFPSSPKVKSCSHLGFYNVGGSFLALRSLDEGRKEEGSFLSGVAEDGPADRVSLCEEINDGGS